MREKGGDDVREPIGLKKCATRSQRRKRERDRNHSHAEKRNSHIENEKVKRK